MISLQMPKIRIYPKSLISQGVIINGFVTNNSHTMLQLSGVSMQDISLLSQMEALNKNIHNNAVVIDLNRFTFSFVE